MADISDVEQAVAITVTSILYPSGPSNSSIIGAMCRVYRGWPNSAALNTDLGSGAVNVTIVTDNDSGRTTTRYLPEWQTVLSQPGIAAGTAQQTITFSGGPALGDVVGALIDGTTYAYRIQSGDTPDLVASNLNRLIEADRPTMVLGSAITVPGAASIKVRAVCDGHTYFEGRRQEKDLRVVCWCPTPAIRDAVASAIDAAVDQLGFLVLHDNTKARIVYRNTASYDQAQNALLYRRDLIYTVEYPTIITFIEPAFLFGVSDLNGSPTYG